MIFACIDIGSNTIRLLVAEGSEDGLREVASQRAFTRIGKSLSRVGALPVEKVAETADVVAEQARTAREAGADHVAAVATAAIRDATNRDELAADVERRSGLPLRVLTSEEEARLSFVGATRTLATPVEGKIAVTDVGGGSTEIAIGDPDGTVSWSSSLRVGSGVLADSHFRSDPPSPAELEAARRHIATILEGLDPPPAATALAVGGSATSLRRFVGTELYEATLQPAIRLLSVTPIAEVANTFGLDAERVRLLPGGILVLAALSERLGRPLTIARGGLREGVVLELLDGRGS